MTNYSTRTNPYDFTTMERWWSEDGSKEAFVGKTRNGETYLTWDVRQGTPVFSHANKVGITILPQDYQHYRKLYYELEGKSVIPLISSNYCILGLKQIFHFMGERPNNHYPPNQQIPRYYEAGRRY